MNDDELAQYCLAFLAPPAGHAGDELKVQINRAYKYELDLNNEQRTACLKHAGAARWAFNFGLRRKKEAYAAGEKTPTAFDLSRELNAMKATEIPWMYEVSKCAPQE